MIVAPFKVVLDANVLFPMTLRDTLLRAAAIDLYQLYWSEEILDETERNLVATGTTTPEQAARLRAAMTEAFPEATVTGYEPLISVMTNDEKDRHVVAAAVKTGAQLIVTANLRDFRSLPAGVEAVSPDEFLCDLYDLDPAAMTRLVEEQSADMVDPPIALDELLLGLERTVPGFVKMLRAATQP